MLEKHIERQIINYLRIKGWLAIKHRSTGRFSEGKLLKLPKDELGVSDIIAVSPDGKVHFIEVKNEKGKQSDYQKTFENMVLRHRSHYTILRSLDDVIQYVKIHG